MDIVRRLMRRLRRRSEPTLPTILDYWHHRVSRLGARAVLNEGHPAGEIQRVTERQKSLLFPALQAQLSGHERRALDFGCGSGRFTRDIARLLAGTAIGVDPIQELLDMAPPDPAVEYRRIGEGMIPLPSESVDLVWICLVLGGIVDEAILQRTVAEIQRVLVPGGLLFLVENTKSAPDVAYWAFRDAEWYAGLFPQLPLEHLLDYRDLDDVNSAFAGRKRGRRGMSGPRDGAAVR